MSDNYHQQFELSEKTAVITGASKGIGAAMAKAFASFGAKVIVSSRKQEAVEEVASKIREQGGEATAVACHVGHEDQLINLITQAVGNYGPVDILVSNAAINPVYGPMAEVDGNIFDKIMTVNVKSCFTLANLCHPIMKANGGGSMINIASVEGLKPSFGLGLYSVSKAALIMLTKNQAKEWGPDGIRSNVICPGLIKTKFSAAIWQDDKVMNQIEKHLPMGRMATPDEMTGLAVFLASNASRYCTGGVYTADGGHMIA
ncbi:MAG: glucose 1-dehydrogenase [Cyclobacteriaceae bacterium]|nr:glucose 1-dehydrogenase [Cyclobacteriaceae bacterium]